MSTTLQEVLLKIAGVDFKGRLLDTTRELYQIERRFGFEAFENSGRYCFQKLKDAGTEEVELLEFPADGVTSYWDKRMPIAWYPESGKLEVTSPAGAFEEPVIADYERNPFHLAMWSRSTPPGGIGSEIVTENTMLGGHSVKEKLVLAEPYHHPRTIFQAVCDRGGLGIVSDYVQDPFVTPDGMFWINTFGEAPGWYPGEDDRELVGFCVTPRVGRKLRELLSSGTVKVRAEVKASKGPGKILAATGVIRGAQRPDEEIWLPAHLYEPIGTDNCVGAGVGLETARVLAELIESGELPRPRRSIRFGFTLELYGFTALLKTLRERGKKLAATFVLDSNAIRQTISKRPIRVHLSPPVNPLFSDQPVKQAARLCLDASSKVWRAINASDRSSERPQYVFYPGYLGNDAFLGDPLAGGPSFHFFAEEGVYWHNSENTFETVWPELLAAMVPVHAGLSHFLGCLGPEDAPQLAGLVEAESRQYLLEAYRESLGDGACPEEFARAMDFRMDLIRRRFENLQMWADRTEQAAALAGNALEKVKSLAAELLKRAGAEGIAPGHYDLEGLDRHDRRALTVVFKRKQPTSPVNQVFVPELRERRKLSSHLKPVLARMDGQKHLLRLFEEEEYFAGRTDRRKVLGDCLWLAEHGYLDASFAEVVTKDDLIAGLRGAGVQEGDLIFVHSSLSAFGHVQGGAQSVVDALLEAVGPSGTVLCPAFTRGFLYFESSPARRLDNEPFHPRLARCWTGRVSETFLRRAGFLRSAHPTHSVAGIGPLAEKCLKDQRVEDPPAGPTSAFARLVEFGGKVVYLGAPLAASTFLHYLETKMNLPYLKGALCCVERSDGETEVVHVRQHLDGHRDFYRTDWENTKIFRALLKAGLQLAHAVVGLGEIHIIKAREFEEKGLQVMQRDPAILLCDNPDCVFCRQWRRRL